MGRIYVGGRNNKPVTADTLVARKRRDDAQALRFLLESRGQGYEFLCRKLGVTSVSRIAALLTGATQPTEAEQIAIDALLAADGA